MYIRLENKKGIQISRQIYESLKEEILLGKLTQGSRLPSTRELASELKVSRNSVIECYEQLSAEGYIMTKSGSGTYVCEGVSLTGQAMKRTLKKDIQKDSPKEKKENICFRTGIPDLSKIPLKQWGCIYKEALEKAEPKQLDYQDAFGSLKLRTCLAEYLERARGVHTTAENILITSGAAQSFSMICGLVGEKEHALVENPLSFGIWHTLESNQVSMQEIPVDENGMVTELLPAVAPKLIFTTPSHQFPTGSVLPAVRRIELVTYAQEKDAYIVEDDYDSEFRFDGRPIQSMQSLCPERVIYVGTFSKSFMPALRMGYLVVPKTVRENLREIKYAADIHSSIPEQLAMAEFIKQGFYERHIRRMRKLYAKKRNKLIEMLKEYFGDRIQISGSCSGLHFVAKFPGVLFTEEKMKEIYKAGVEITALQKHCIHFGHYEDMLLFGYGNADLESMEEGIRLLKTKILP